LNSALQSRSIFLIFVVPEVTVSLAGGQNELVIGDRHAGTVFVIDHNVL